MLSSYRYKFGDAVKVEIWIIEILSLIWQIVF